MGQTKIPRHGCRSVRDGRGEGLGWCLNHSVTMRDLLQTVVDGLGPHERLGALVIEPNQLVDRRPQLRQTVEDASPNARALTEPPFDEAQSRGTRWCDVQMKAWRSRQPLLDSGVVGRLSLSRIKWRACPGDVSRSMTCRKFSHSSWRWRREQAGGAVGLVVMRQGTASPLLHRHARVCSIQRVDLRLFIHAHHIRQCLHTPRVLRPLERFDPVRGARGVRPRSVPRWLGLFGATGGGRWPMGGILGQTRRSRFVEPCPPQQHGGTRGLPAMGHRVIGEPLGRQQVDPRSEYNPLGTGLRSHPCLQHLRLCSRHRQRVGWFPPAPDDTRPTPYQNI